MKRCPRIKTLPTKETGIILLAPGGGILCACFLPPQATVVLLSLLVALSGVCMILKNGGGQC